MRAISPTEFVSARDDFTDATNIHPAADRQSLAFCKQLRQRFDNQFATATGSNGTLAPTLSKCFINLASN